MPFPVFFPPALQEQANAGAKGDDLPPQTIEINPAHPLIVALYGLKDNPGSVAPLVAAQLLDNCLMAAGLVEDPRYMIPRLNDLLLATALHHKQELEHDAQHAGVSAQQEERELEALREQARIKEAEIVGEAKKE